MAARRVKVISDRLFHKLWDHAKSYDYMGDFIDAYTNSLSDKCINWKNYEIDYVLACEILRCIYENSNKSIAVLLREIDISNAKLSHRFCIPIKTIEAWKCGRTDCPGYVKLMLMEEYGITYLPKHVYTESLNERKRIHTASTNRKLSYYNSSSFDEETINNTEDNQPNIINTNIDNIDIKCDTGLPEHAHYSFSDIDAYLTSLDNKDSFSLKDFESQDSAVQHLLDQTDYLTLHMKRQN